MPQKGLKRVDLSTLPERDDHIDPTNLIHIDFNPYERSAHTGLSIYDSIFKEFEEDYFDVTGNQINLSKGKPISKTIDITKDLGTKHDMELYRNAVLKEASNESEFRIGMHESQKEAFANEWAGNMHGMVQYMSQYLPPKGTPEGKEMRERFDNILDRAYNNFYAPIIQFDAKSSGEIHMNDDMGDFWKQTYAKGKMALGTGMQAQDDLLGAISKALYATGPKGMPTDFSKTVESYADTIFKKGVSLEESGKKGLEEAAPPTGRYSLSVQDRWRGFSEAEGFGESFSELGKALADVPYYIYKGSESLGSQVLTTGAAVAGGIAVGSNPAVAGGSLILRLGMQAIGSTPGLFAGYVLESGDAYSSARDEITALKLRAEQDRDNPDFEDIYSVWVSPSQKVAADKLTPEQIREISTEVGKTYGAVATAVEAVSTAGQVGYGINRASKILRGEMASGGGRLSKYLAKKMSKTVLKAGGAVKWLGSSMGLEGLEEGFQEYLQESILSKTMPSRKKNYSQIVDAAVSGATFGMGMQSFRDVKSYTKKRINAAKKLRESEQDKKNRVLETARGAKDESLDVSIMSGIAMYGDVTEFIPTIVKKRNDQITNQYLEDKGKRKKEDLSPGEKEDLENLISETGLTEDYVRGRAQELFGKKAFEGILTNPSILSKFYDKNKEEIEGIYGITEDNLRKPGILSDAQVAKILDIEVKDLKKREKPVKKGKQKEFKQDAEYAESMAREADAAAGIISAADMQYHDEDLTQYSDPTSQPLEPDDAVLDGKSHVAEFEVSRIDQELATLDVSYPNKTVEELDIIRNNLMKERASYMKESTEERKIPDAKGRVDTKTVQKYMDKVRHIGINSFTDEERTIVAKLEDPNLEPKVLNQIRRTVDNRTKEIKSDISKTTGLKPGDTVELSDGIQNEKYAGETAVVLSINPDQAFVKLEDGTRINVAYNLLSRSKNQSPKKGSTFETERGTKLFYRGGKWMIRTKGGARAYPKNKQDEITTQWQKQERQTDKLEEPTTGGRLNVKAFMQNRKKLDGEPSNILYNIKESKLTLEHGTNEEIRKEISRLENFLPKVEENPAEHIPKNGFWQKGDSIEKRVSELKDILKQLSNKLKVPVKESAKDMRDKLERDMENDPSIAKTMGIVAANTIDKFAQIAKKDMVWSQDILENMSDERLIETAKNLVIPDVEGKDRKALITEIIDKQGNVELHGGLFAVNPIKRTNLVKIHKMFRQGWYQTLKKDGVEPYHFPNYREYISQRMPDQYRKYFDEWAEGFKPKLTYFDKVTMGVEQAFREKSSKSDLLSEAMMDIERGLVEGADQLMENISQKLSEEADVHIENYNHLNSRIFEAMDVIVGSETFGKVVDAAKTAKSFEAFTKEISRKEYEMIDKEGRTPVDIIASGDPAGRKLKQFYVSQLPENNIRINSGDLAENENPGGKRVNIKLNRDKRRGWHGFGFKQKESTGKNNPVIGRATMADRFLDLDLVWLNGSDVTSPTIKKDAEGNALQMDSGKPFFQKTPIYGFLSSEDIKKITREHLSNRGLTPLFIKGDSDIMALARVNESHIQKAMSHEAYWEEEMQNGRATETQIKKYKGGGKTDEEMASLFGSPLSYRAANIARHEKYVELFGENYHTLSAHKLMHRIKIMFTPALTRTGGRKSSMMILNLDKSKEAVDNGKSSPFISRVVNKDGSIHEKPLVKIINGIAQYVGDGQTLTSEAVFNEKYADEVGANPIAKRAKTVKVIRDDSGLLLVKHQEMTFDLPQDAKHAELVLGGEKVAEIRRDKGLINIYTKDKDGEFTVYTDHIATNDEAKVSMGDYNSFNQVMELPSEATGHIMLTEGDKQKAPFPMQLANYIDDEEFVNGLNQLMRNRSNSYSASVLLDRLFDIAKNPKKFDAFIKRVKKHHPDGLPRMIVEAAEMGAGLHPSQLDYGGVLAKVRLMGEAMDLLQDGAVLDFRANYSGDTDGIILPFEHSIRDVVLNQLVDKTDLDITQLRNLSLDELNLAIKSNPINVMMVRHPVPSKAGYRIYKIDRFEFGIGDSFKISDADVKEVFEGDNDHDTGHIMVLPKYMEKALIKNESVLGGDIESYAKDIQSPNIGSIEDTIDLMGEMTKGKISIGEVSNVQRVAGIAQKSFDYIEIDGKKVKARSLNAKVKDEDIGEEHSLESMLRLYAQAAFDNVSLRLLKKWNYSQQKLYSMVFYNSDGSPLTDTQYQVLNALYIDLLKDTQAIRKGHKGSANYKLSDMLLKSESYDRFIEDREGFLKRKALSGTYFNGKESKPIANHIGKIKMKEGIHPHEKLAVLPYERMSLSGMTRDDVLKLGSMESKLAHGYAHSNIANYANWNKHILAALEKDTGGKIKSTQGFNRAQSEETLSAIQRGRRWGSHMRSGMNEVYKQIVNNEFDAKEVVNNMTWDYNEAFVDFTEDWLDGNKEKGITGFNELSEIEKVAATFSFMDGVFDGKGGINKYNVRKIPPVSNKPGQSLLHPDIMKEYFAEYNDGIEKAKSGELDKVARPAPQINHTERFFGCK